ncbi:MAG: MarR family transcriptional regulator [Candidatus Omnitrophica bacterium]|nr:MarR family transcriptional regulator [Candidatus Omnitrophota bacterium]
MATGKQEDFAVEMSRMLPTLMRAVTGRMEACLTDANLAVSHIVVLDMLREKGPCSMSELAQALNLSMGAATAIIDKMIQMELVERARSSEDRRVVNVTMRQKGSKISEEVNKMRVEATKELYSVLNESERNDYLRMIRKIYNNITKER